MDVTAGELRGKATLVNRVLPDGTKYVRLGMILTDANQRNVSVLQESTYDQRGRPVRHLQVTNLAGNAARQSITVTFDGGRATVRIDQGGQRTETTSDAPAGVRIEALPEFWFVRDKPKAGDVSTYWRFDLGRQEWVETRAVYHGRRSIQVGGKEISAHLVTFGESRAYVDDEGDPWRIESPGAVMVRRLRGAS